MIRALGFVEVYITFAASGEEFTRRLLHVQGRNIVQCANYPGYVLDECARLGFSRATLCGHPGKLLKVAAGSFNTHSRVSGGSLEALCTQLAMLGASPDLVSRVYSSNTTREAIAIVEDGGYANVWGVLARIVSAKCRQRAKIPVSALFIDGERKILGRYCDA